jgi:hypothetical protein
MLEANKSASVMRAIFGYVEIGMGCFPTT